MAMAGRGYRTRGDLAAAAGVSIATVSNVLGGEGGQSRQLIERALGWSPGSIRSVLDGGAPVEQAAGGVLPSLTQSATGTSTAPPAPQNAAELRAQIQAAGWISEIDRRALLAQVDAIEAREAERDQRDAGGASA